MQYERARTANAASVLCRQFAGRGLLRCVRGDCELQQIRDDEIEQEYPRAYRYSHLSPVEQTAYCTGKYNGTHCMTSDDLVRYFRDGHDVSSEESVELRWGGAGIVSDTPSKKNPLIGIRSKKDRNGKELTAVSENDVTPFQAFLGHWLPNKETKYIPCARHHVPVYLIAVLMIFVLSMALLVGSTFLLRDAEGDVLALRNELSEVEQTENELAAKLEMKYDLNAIQHTVEDTYGMICVADAKTSYLSLEDTENISVYQTKESQDGGFFTILSMLFGGN